MGCPPRAGTSVAENANRTSGAAVWIRAQGITALIWTAKPILASRSLMTGAWNSSRGQSGGFNATPVTPIFIKVLQKVLHEKVSKINGFWHFVTPVTPIFKYKYKKICKIAKLQIVLFLKK